MNTIRLDNLFVVFLSRVLTRNKVYETQKLLPRDLGDVIGTLLKWRRARVDSPRMRASRDLQRGVVCTYTWCEPTRVNTACSRYKIISARGTKAAQKHDRLEIENMLTHFKTL